MSVSADVHMEEGGTIEAEIDDDGWIKIIVDPNGEDRYLRSVRITMDPTTTPELCERIATVFGLQESPPAGESEGAGLPAGERAPVGATESI